MAAPRRSRVEGPGLRREEARAEPKERARAEPKEEARAEPKERAWSIMMAATGTSELSDISVTARDQQNIRSTAQLGESFKMTLRERLRDREERVDNCIPQSQVNICLNYGGHVSC